MVDPLRTDQQSLPMMDKFVRVHVHYESKLLRVTAAHWDQLSPEEREEYIFDACCELGWFNFDFAEVTS